jgi:hypothetical protein
MSTAELEIHLIRSDSGYAVAMLFRHAEIHADNVLSSGRASLDRNGLGTLEDNSGPELTRQLLADPVVLQNSCDACVASESVGVSLRIRLFVDPKIAEHDEGCMKFISLFTTQCEGPFQPDSSHIAALAFLSLETTAKRLRDSERQVTPTFRCC